MKAVNNYIVITEVKEERKSENGLLILDQHTNDIRYLKGKVVSIGENTVGVKEGDVIYYDRHAGHGIEYKNVIYKVIKQPDVVIVE
jgi:co-chaperonin GroES (HSP10)